jgi:hypothetical protein
VPFQQSLFIAGLLLLFLVLCQQLDCLPLLVVDKVGVNIIYHSDVLYFSGHLPILLDEVGLSVGWALDSAEGHFFCGLVNFFGI